MSDLVEFECGDCGFRVGPVDIGLTGFTGILSMLSFFGILYIHQGSCGAVGGMAQRASWLDGEAGPSGPVLP